MAKAAPPASRQEIATPGDCQEGQEEQRPNELVEGALQEDGEQQQGNFRNPTPAVFPVDQEKDQGGEPGEEEIPTPGGVTGGEVRQDVAVEIKEGEQDDKRRWREGKPAPQPEQSEETQAVQEQNVHQDELAHLQETQQYHLGGKDLVRDGQEAVGDTIQGGCI